MDAPDFRAAAERIRTGTTDPDTSRALVVFNTTAAPLSGVAVFDASMSWPLENLMPFVAVTDMDGQAVASDMVSMAEGPDSRGRADRRLLSFRLHFAVHDVPANGWRTYLAFLAGDMVPPDEIAAPDPEGLDVETDGLQVVETTRHGGGLPPVGTF